jgi:hypothetical protein
LAFGQLLAEPVPGLFTDIGYGRLAGRFIDIVTHGILKVLLGLKKSCASTIRFGERSSS